MNIYLWLKGAGEVLIDEGLVLHVIATQHVSLHAVEEVALEVLITHFQGLRQSRLGVGSRVG